MSCVISPLAGLSRTKTQAHNAWLQLHAACHERWIQAIEFFLVTGVDINHVSSCGLSPLYIACQSNDEMVIRLLVENNVDPSIICTNHKTAVHKAVSSLNYSVVQLLLKCKNADLNMLGGEGDTCLHRAVNKNKLDVVRLLLKQDVDVNILNHKCVSPLHIAVARRNPDIAHALLK